MQEEEEGETKVRPNKRMQDNMATGQSWQTKLWIGLNEEALIGIE